MITSVWISPDRTRIIVQCDGEDGPITEINTDATYPDGVSFECLDVDMVDARCDDLYPLPEKTSATRARTSRRVQ